MSSNLRGDPILEAYHLWIEHGWEESAAGTAVVTSILRVNSVLNRRADQILAPIDITFARYVVLVTLHFNDGELALKQLGAFLQIHQSSITNLVDKLENQGLVKRTPHPNDRRSTIAKMTEAGSTTLLQAIKLLNTELFTDLGLTEDEVRLLIGTLAKMRHSWGDFEDHPEWGAPTSQVL